MNGAHDRAERYQLRMEKLAKLQLELLNDIAFHLVALQALGAAQDHLSNRERREFLDRSRELAKAMSERVKLALEELS